MSGQKAAPRGKAPGGGSVRGQEHPLQWGLMRGRADPPQFYTA